MASLFKGIGQFIKGKYVESAQTVLGLINGWKFFAEHEVVVGIPEEDGSTNEEGISNAQLLYLHENGVPSHNIPPRPVLEPALSQEETQDKIRALLKDAAKQALLHGNKEAAEKGYQKAGMVGRDACKKWITDGTHLAPNAPSTIQRKGSSTPLIDTASMLNSITYSVRKKKR